MDDYRQLEPLQKIPTATSETYYDAPTMPEHFPIYSQNLSRDAQANLLRRVISLHEAIQESSSPSEQTQTSSELSKQRTNLSLTPSNTQVDPRSEDFNWRTLLRVVMRAQEQTGVTQRRTGVSFKNLTVTGKGSALHLQSTVPSVLLEPFGYFSQRKSKDAEKPILRSFDGFIKEGEMLVVLGRPGAGCSTLLKTICGETHGLDLKETSSINYSGIPHSVMHKRFKGEVIYNQEVEKHFPHLTVGQTLEFAAAVRTPQNRLKGMSRAQYVTMLRDVMLTVFGLSHTVNTKVGNDFVRGVSGGERKRVSIAEMALARAAMGAWDNSTRGLDSATALEFVRTLHASAEITGQSHLVAIYQASQEIYNLFDKAIVLYEGREIYFGSCRDAKAYFEDMGWECPQRQTTGDFLTSVTNPGERKAKNGWERKVPRTPDEFERIWRESPQRKSLLQEIEYFASGDSEAKLNEFKVSRKAEQSKHISPKSPYTISVPMQIRLCIKRAYQRILGDFSNTATQIGGQVIMSLIIGSVFYPTQNNTSGFYAKGSVLFFAILFNALSAISEINLMYEQRPIVEKHASYAFYHPFAEAIGSLLSDIPLKFVLAAAFNLVVYFLAQLRREPSQFFIFFLFAYISTLCMSTIFRSLAAATKSIAQAMALAGVMVLAIVIYTGFVIPRPTMKVWFKWISYINPIAFSYEALITNEMHGRLFPCATLVPQGPGATLPNQICSIAGAVAGQDFVSGDAYLEASYQYSYSNIWRNLGIVVAFYIFFLFVYLLLSEYNTATTSTAEVLLFRRGHVPKHIEASLTNDEEKASRANALVDEQVVNEQEEAVDAVPKSRDTFTWQDVKYDITIKGEPRTLLNNISGWVKPGTLTALMGVSGAGKTTLLDTLAQRVSTGVVTGDMLVNGKPLDASFQRKTGYVQQQDLHLETTTVREALCFSANLRQPKSTRKKEKLEYVEEVIKMLDMEDYAEAVVGVPGEGLNVEQRKRLTIGVELAAKPELLLFLDEPTSGLDSQSAWSICAFLRKLANNGQAVLCTIHQPSAVLFQEFDRLLFLAKGGKTVYFGDIGPNSRTLLDYFESHGAEECPHDANPAEYMMDIIGAGPSGKSNKDWTAIWNDSKERKSIMSELETLHSTLKDKPTNSVSTGEFAVPMSTQVLETTKRVFQQYWRTPSYIYAKLMLCVLSALFIGFSFFKADATQQGLQNQMFSIFMITSIFSTLVQQIMPRFVVQRSLYEVRERPSKSYSWKAFLLSNIIVEIPYQIIAAVVTFFSWYYPIGYYRNAVLSDSVTEREG